MAQLTGNDKEGRAKKNTPVDKQKRLLRPLTAIIFVYDNYQPGLRLQYQRGEHSTAFFKGTHQCCHMVRLFEDTSFDAMFVLFTQEDQAIPSPWGMPAFELENLCDPAEFLMNYSTFELVSTPDFTGSRVDAYIDFRDLCVRLSFIERAFPSSKDGNNYFEQCPT